jgi:hypothetical protein
MGKDDTIGADADGENCGDFIFGSTIKAGAAVGDEAEEVWFVAAFHCVEEFDVWESFFPH